MPLRYAGSTRHSGNNDTIIHGVFELLYTDKNTGNTLTTKAGEFNEYEILKKDKSTSGLANAHVTNREVAERFGVSKATAVAVRWFPELNKEEEMIALQL